MPVHMDSGKIKGYGYVNYPTVEAAEAMMAEKGSTMTIDNRECNLDYAPYDRAQTFNPTFPSKTCNAHHNEITWNFNRIPRFLDLKLIKSFFILAYYICNEL